MRRACYKCERRYTACWSSCPDYAKDQATIKAGKNEDKKIKLADAVLSNRGINTKEQFSKASGHRIKLKEFR